ncbi:hypothetical protein [Mongoliibacter ruber]|uniref:hypothetical protein n=1 Tax=Mongoliibacter ruber TaxID=1750599 RepID=UPI000D04CDB7|nr:hypothetical protein [Mongoliibacter ruber]
MKVPRGKVTGLDKSPGRETLCLRVGMLLKSPFHFKRGRLIGRVDSASIPHWELEGLAASSSVMVPISTLGLHWHLFAIYIFGLPYSKASGRNSGKFPSMKETI